MLMFIPAIYKAIKKRSSENVAVEKIN